MRKAYQQLNKHSHILTFYRNNNIIMNGVFHYPAFFEEGNNDLANVFALKLMGLRVIISIPGTCHVYL